MKTMRMSGVLALAVLGLTATAFCLMPASRSCAATATVSFADDVYPIFHGRCVSCHQPGGEGFEKSGLDLSSYEGLMKGTKFGPVIKPGDPETSNLIWLLDWRGSPELRMPHGKKKLSTCASGRHPDLDSPRGQE